VKFTAAPVGFTSGVGVVVEGLGGSEVGLGGETSGAVQAATNVDVTRMSTAAL